VTIDNYTFATDFTEVAEADAVTSLEGTSFCISAPSGDIVPDVGTACSYATPAFCRRGGF
jgi:hypothetical protein